VDERRVALPTVHTHYDNLRVARTAPPEVIRAAYKALAQKYHPDRNVRNPDAERIMRIINAAFEVLSDPVRRREHDKWIAQAESPSLDDEEGTATTASQSGLNDEAAADWVSSESSAPTRFPQPYTMSGVQQIPIWSGLAVALAIGWALIVVYWPSPKPVSELNPSMGVPSSTAASTLDRSQPAPSNSPRSRPAPRTNAALTVEEFLSSQAVPSVEPRPEQSGYITGSRRLGFGGHSRVTIDNVHGGSDVLLKLVDIGGESRRTVRTIFLRAGDKFTIESVRAGTYDIRYRDLDSGRLSKSQPFTLHELDNRRRNRIYAAFHHLVQNTEW
jgi:hypothetical protein